MMDENKRRMRSREPGLRDLGDGQWYGGGYCGVCGSTTIVPRPCRWWDPDDGWRVGVLCEYCREEAAVRGPRPDDFAYEKHSGRDEAIDTVAELLGEDYDGLVSNVGDA